MPELRRNAIHDLLARIRTDCRPGKIGDCQKNGHQTGRKTRTNAEQITKSVKRMKIQLINSRFFSLQGKTRFWQSQNGPIFSTRFGQSPNAPILGKAQNWEGKNREPGKNDGFFASLFFKKAAGKKQV